MNILYELGLQGRGTLMLIPTNMPTAGTGSVIQPYGVIGVKDIQELSAAGKPSGSSTSQNTKQ